ncbi:MAG TPA: inorganic phosphate transporter [Acidimicrobiales bacterium]|nr:inorganic phosphate transporter [Acidimicrobiales bacterium]
MHNTLLLAIVVTVALAFDFTNGFHDTANAVAPTIATGALKPRTAVALSSLFNLVGAFLSLKVAATIASALVAQNLVTLPVIFAGLIGAIAWNVTTWYFAIPSSSSHALIGGVIGAMLVLAGGHAVLWGGLISKVIIPAGLAPLVALVAAGVAVFFARRLTAKVDRDTSTWGFRVGQIGSSSLLSIAHGTNDAQKTMGVVTLALIANGTLSSNSSTPAWVVVSCAIAIAMGTFFGGWRIIRTMGHGFTQLTPQQGFAAQIASSAVILTSSHMGLPLSTTHVATGSIVGVGAATPNQRVRWRLAGDVAMAWVITLPAAGLFGAFSYYVAHLIGGTFGVAVLALVAAGYVAILMKRSRRHAVNATNVNDLWGAPIVPIDASPVVAA